MTFRPERVLTVANVDDVIRSYRQSIADVGMGVRERRGLELLSWLKRDVVGAGPYPNVTLFEAANRIMTDLVMLHGVRWLLKENAFPFRAYTVEYGHGNEGAHDIVASGSGKTLIGEVFNVAPSFFPLKKASVLKKLRASKIKPEYRVLLVNHDAVAPSYVPKPEAGEYLLFVDIQAGACRVVAGRS